MDEFELIQRITPRSLSHREIEIGIGDDAAVYHTKNNYQEIVAVDTMVDGIHFYHPIHRLPISDIKHWL